MRFSLEKSAEYLEKGLRLEREGNLKEARYNLLKAAESLYQAAEKSEPTLKRKRIERAEGIVQRVKALGQTLTGKSALPAISQSESADRYHRVDSI